MDRGNQIFWRSIDVDLRVRANAGKNLTLGNQNYRQPKNALYAADKLGPLLDGKGMAHNRNVETGGTTFLKYVFNGNRRHHLKAGGT